MNWADNRRCCRAMELLHYTDCILLFHDVARSIRLIHPFFLRTGGGPGTEQFRMMLAELCQHNPVLALTGRLFCLREYGDPMCSVVNPGAPPPDGTPSPACVCCVEDRVMLGWGFAAIVQQSLKDCRTEANHLIVHGTRKDGQTGATDRWVENEIQTINQLSRVGFAWSPKKEFGAELLEHAKETNMSLRLSQEKRFTAEPRHLTGVAVTGSQRVKSATTTPEKPTLLRGFSTDPKEAGGPLSGSPGSAWRVIEARRGRGEPKAKAQRSVNF